VGGRYRSSLIDSERYFLPCSRYIETNPVRAGLVSRPEDFQWSRFRSNAGGHPDALVRRHAMLLALGRSDSTRRAAYRALFETPLDARVLDAIRRATNKGIALGVDDRRAYAEPDAVAREARRGLPQSWRRPTATSRSRRTDIQESDPKSLQGV
jgi:putative transposase